MKNLVILLVFGLVHTGAFAATFDWSHFEKALQTHVSEGIVKDISLNLLNYRALKKDPEFSNIASQLAVYDPSALTGNEKLAFYINAYNYYAIKFVLDNWPVKSIRDPGSIISPVWGHTVGKINNKPVSMDYIEHSVLRKLDEPRIHFAIVCASLSCPDLRTEVYVAQTLDAQLGEQTRAFLNNPTKGAAVKDGQLYLSKIFGWFKADFKKPGGVIPFISQYRPDFKSFEKFKTLDYHWDLNSRL